MKKFFSVVIFALLYLSVSSKPADEEYDDYVARTFMNDDNTEVQNDDKDLKSYDYIGLDNPDPTVDESQEAKDEKFEKEKLPKILTTPQSHNVKPGESLILECKVQDLGDYVLIWSNDTIILFQAGLKFYDIPNFQLLDDGSLQIKNVSLLPHKSLYKCSVPITETNKLSVIHTVTVQQPPQIIKLEAKNNHTVLKQGETLELYCEAVGSPTPRITWHINHEHHDRQYELLPITGNDLIVTNITHKGAGSYRCLADNGLKPLAHASIEIAVQHKPHVELEQLMVNANYGLSVELKCTVYANPSGSVVWQKDEKNIHKDERRTKSSKGNHHYLIIHNVTESDFGTYSCVASNYLGRVSKDVKLIKTPAIVKFVKPEKPLRDAELNWTVDSKTPLKQTELYYRKAGEKKWQIIKPEVINIDKHTYEVKHTLHNLEPGKYEAKLRTMNEHGWSDFSDVMVFEGSASGSYMHKQHKKHNNTKDKVRHTTPSDEAMNQPQQGDKAPNDTPASDQNTDTELTKNAQVGASSAASNQLPATLLSLVSIALLSVYCVRQ